MTTGKTTVKKPYSKMPKITRKKLHWGMKANRYHQICRRVMKKKTNMMTEPVPRTTTAAATELAPATTEVTGISAPEEDPRNG